LIFSKSSISEIRERIISKGLSEDDLQRCIDSYAEDDVWMLVANGTKIRWIGIEDDGESDEDL
jgi:DNA replication licensing factor MCM7